MRRRWSWMLAALALIAAHFSSFDIVHQALQTDSRYYLYFSQRVIAGAVPHRDFFDNKPQLATFFGAALMKVAALMRADPLMVVRAGFICIMAASCLMMFAVFRQLLNGRGGPAMLALVLCTSFAVFGALPATGNFPKPLMALFAMTAVWLVGRQRWLTAGICGALATMDWQIGVLVVVGVMAAAVASPGKRLKNILLSMLGVLIGLLPFFCYFAAHGALRDAKVQLVDSALARGGGELSKQPLSTRLDRMMDSLRDSCPGPGWLGWLGFHREEPGDDRAAMKSLAADISRKPGARLPALWKFKLQRIHAAAAIGIIGMCLLPVWLWNSRKSGSIERDNSRFAVLLMLAVYHYGVVAFSLLDFQWLPDLLILLYSIAFFAGVTGVTLYLQLRRAVLHMNLGRMPQTVGCCVLLAAAVFIAQPSLLRTKFALGGRVGRVMPTLEDQRNVHHQYRALAAGRRSACLAGVEMLILGGEPSVLPFIYWNTATHHQYRRSPDESSRETLSRLIEACQPDVLLPDNRVLLDSRITRNYRSVTLVSPNKTGVIPVMVRTAR